MAPGADQYRLSEADHRSIFENDITPALFAGVKPSGRPVAVIFGGQPGAGKSAALEAASRDLEPRGGAAQIIGDDLRDFHPRYGDLLKRDDNTAAFYTDRDTGRWVEMAIAEAKARRVNVVIEGTMRDAGKVADTMLTLRSLGYEIDARVLAVNERFSQQGILQRYEGQKADRGNGRMTTVQAHQAAYDGMPVTVERIEREKLADRITVYRRGAEAIYTNALQAGGWTQDPQARAALEAERSRPMTLHELRSYAEGFDRLADLLARPGRQASAEEIGNVARLLQAARAELAVAQTQQPAHEAAACALLGQAPAQAVKDHPRLAGAFATMGAYDAALKAQGIDETQRGQAIERMRQSLAREVMDGRYPAIKTGQLRFPNAPAHETGPEPTSGLSPG